MTLRRSLLELVRALCVLGLVFLNFGHGAVGAPAPAGALPGDVLTLAVDASFCGQPIEGPQDHAPCHACRIGGGADLPPAPPSVCAPVDVVGVVGAVEIAPLPVLAMFGRASPRGPPVA
jgi:hypothetical protein